MKIYATNCTRMLLPECAKWVVNWCFWKEIVALRMCEKTCLFIDGWRDDAPEEKGWRWCTLQRGMNEAVFGQQKWYRVVLPACSMDDAWFIRSCALNSPYMTFFAVPSYYTYLLFTAMTHDAKTSFSFFCHWISRRRGACYNKFSQTLAFSEIRNLQTCS